MSNCNPPTCSQSYDPSCESMECVFNVDAVNIDKLFKRTDDLKEGYEINDQKIIDNCNDIISAVQRINALEENFNNIEQSYVTSEAEFAAVLNTSKNIFIKGSVTLNNQYNILIATKISGEPGSVLTCTNPSYVFNLAASFELSNLKVLGASPNAGYLINIGGTQRTGVNSYFQMTNCWFENFGNVVTMTGGPTAPLGPKTIIYNCDFKNIGSVSFNGFGKEAAIYMDWNLGFTVIDSCRFHDGSIWGNAINLSNSGDPLVTTLGESLYIIRNQVINCHRNGIETFSAGKAFIVGNYIEGGDGANNLPNGSGMGISCAGGNSIVANNTLKNIYSYAIEIYKANNICTGNFIDGVTIDVSNATAARGISADNATNSIISNNLLKNILFANYPKYAIVTANSSNITIRNNYFENVSYGVQVYLGCENITVRDNDFNLNVSPAFLLGIPPNSYTPAACIIFSGIKNKLLNNAATIQSTLSGVISPAQIQTLFSLQPGAAAYVNFTPTYIGPIVGSLTGVTNTSSNIAI